MAQIFRAAGEEHDRAGRSAGSGSVRPSCRAEPPHLIADQQRLAEHSARSIEHHQVRRGAGKRGAELVVGAGTDDAAHQKRRRLAFSAKGQVNCRRANYRTRCAWRRPPCHVSAEPAQQAQRKPHRKVSKPASLTFSRPQGSPTPSFLAENQEATAKLAAARDTTARVAELPLRRKRDRVVVLAR